MSRKSGVTLIVGLFSALCLIGCSKNSNPVTQNNNLGQPDQAALEQMVSQDALFTSDASILNDGSTALAKSAGAFIPKNWARLINVDSVSRTVTFNKIDDTTVIATVTTYIAGQVGIRVKQTPTDTIIYKPLSETFKRNVRFVRITSKIDTTQFHWRLDAVTPMAGGTDSSGITILSVTFFTDSDTLQITDPLNYYLPIRRPMIRWCMPELPQSVTTGFKIQVTVKSTDPDSDIVVAHRPIWFLRAGVYRRASMSLVSSVSNGDGTYTRVYENSWQGAWSGRHEAIVDAITRQSIYDETAPFSSQVWGIPYIVQ